jgi:hypothetical protein
MRALDSAVSLCSETGISLRVYWVKTYNINCAFSDLFEPIPGLEIIEKKMPFVFDTAWQSGLYNPRVYRKLPDWLILNRNNVQAMAEDGFDFKLLKYHRVLMASSYRFYPTEKMYAIFVPIESLRQRIDMESASFDQNTIGIHIRRTDNRISIENSPTELFAQSIEKEIALNPNVNFFLASDCATTKQQLYNRYGDRIITNFDKSERATKEGIQQALVELYTLSRARKIYGSYWSSFSHTAADISGIEEITVRSHDKMYDKTGYNENRKDFNYVRRVIELLTEFSTAGCESIIDVGSREVDVISGLPLKVKVSIDLEKPLVAEGVESITGDFFDYREKEMFDIVCCFQTLEHISEVEQFAEKLFDLTKKYVFISVPYKWSAGLCKDHIHDPVDEEKLAIWTKKQPIVKEIIVDRGRQRIICIYKK